MNKFHQKVTTGLLLICLVSLPVVLGSIYSLMRVTSEQNDLISTKIQTLLLARDLRNQKSRQMTWMPVFILTGNLNILSRLNADKRHFVNTVAALGKIHLMPGANALLVKIRKAQQDYDALGELAIEMKRKGVQTQKINAYFDQVPAEQADLTISLLDQLVNYTSAEYDQEKDNSLNLSSTIIRFFALASALAIVFCLVITGLLLRLIRQKIIFDQTNSRLVEKEKQLSHARKEIVEIVAHDLKSPLSSVTMSAKIIRKQGPQISGSELNKFLEIILNSAYSMQHLITDLLDHTKIEAGNLILVKSPYNISSLLRELTLRFEPIAIVKNIYFKISIAPDIGLISIDGGRIEQVISNLIGNAIKFTPPDGSICITLEKNQCDVIISVADTGMGMTKEQASHVFERFWQVRGSANLGTGLGLSISKAVMEAHQGKIWVTSETGKGSTFFISIPTAIVWQPTTSFIR